MPSRVCCLMLITPLLGFACSNGGPTTLAAAVAPQTASYHVAPRGSDSNPGTSAQPWKTLRHAFRQLHPGATLWLHDGVYRERGLDARFPGDAAAPIRIRSAIGERATIDASLAEFADSPEKSWVVHDAQLGIFRSARAWPGLGAIYGALPKDDGGRALVPYATYKALAATSEDYAASGETYCGPGLHYDTATGTIYARMTTTRTQAAMRHKQPTVEDPRRLRLRIQPSGAALRLTNGSRHIELLSIDLRGAEFGMEITEGCDHVSMRDCTLEAGRYGVLARGNATDLEFTHLAFDGLFPPWVARSDVKMPASGPPANLLQGAAFQLEGSLARVRIADCSMRNAVDGIDTTDAATYVEIAACTFTGMRDDAIEIAASAHHVDIHDNHIVACCAGVSWNGHVAPPPAATGTKWIHHNVIDTSANAFYGRDDPQGLLPPAWRGPGLDGMATGRPFGLHDTSGMTAPDPWKVYCNTVIAGVDVDGDGIGIAYRFAPVDPLHPHEVFDNVFWLQGDQCMLRHARVHDGSQIFDGNVWRRTGAAPTTPLLRECTDGTTARDFLSWSALRNSSHGALAAQRRAGGWEPVGFEGDPQLDAELRPIPGGPASSVGLPLNGLPWPDSARSAWRGALPPP